MTNTVSQIISALLIALAVAAIGTLMFINARQFVKNNAIDGCYQTARIAKTDGAQTVTTPENYWFDQCMKKKGY